MLSRSLLIVVPSAIALLLGTQLPRLEARLGDAPAKATESTKATEKTKAAVGYGYDRLKRTSDPLPVPDPPGPAPQPTPQPQPSIPQLAVKDYSAAPGEVVVIEPTTNCREVQYYAIDKGLSIIPRKYLNSQTDCVVWGITPGQYRLLAYSSLNDVQTDPVIATITITGIAPQPPPNPPAPPNPTPPAPAVTYPQPFSIITIDNAAARTPAIAAVVSPAYWQKIRTAGHSVWLMDSNNKAETADYAAQVAAAGGGNTIILLDANRKVITAQALPATTADVTALIAKYGGKLPAGAKR